MRGWSSAESLNLKKFVLVFSASVSRRYQVHRLGFDLVVFGVVGEFVGELGVVCLDML